MRNVSFLQDAEQLLMQAISLRPEAANYHANLGRPRRFTEFKVLTLLLS